MLCISRVRNWRTLDQSRCVSLWCVVLVLVIREGCFPPYRSSSVWCVVLVVVIREGCFPPYHSSMSPLSVCLTLFFLLSCVLVCVSLSVLLVRGLVLPDLCGCL
jgi:hypothetical protein